jgi:hypothetical protein
MAERGVILSYEVIRKCGPIFAQGLRRRRPHPDTSGRSVGTGSTCRGRSLAHEGHDPPEPLQPRPRTSGANARSGPGGRAGIERD